MSEAGGLSSTDYRLGFHKPINRPWQPVIYSAVLIDGTEYAVIDACILIGTVASQNALVKQIRDLGNAPVLFTDPKFDLQAGAIKGAAYRWKNGRVPYEIAAGLPSPERIRRAIDHWQEKTGIRLVPRTTDDQDWVLFKKADGCASYIGRQGGRQEIFVGPNCTRGNIIHEIGHCIGLYHEQSRSDRNGFVEIKWDNIDPTARHNFNQEDSENLSPYDFCSIMHYPAAAFSINGKDTIIPKQPLPPGGKMGQRNGLSDHDIAAVAKLYS